MHLHTVSMIIGQTYFTVILIRPFQNYPQRNEKLVSYIIPTLQ